MNADSFILSAIFAPVLMAPGVFAVSASVESLEIPVPVAVSPSAGVLNGEGWNTAVDPSLMMTQNAYSDNWVGG